MIKYQEDLIFLDKEQNILMTVLTLSMTYVTRLHCWIYHCVSGFLYLIPCLCFLGTTDISFIDPVVLGRTFFNTINDAVGGIMGYIQDLLCTILDTVLGISKGNKSQFHLHVLCKI